MNQTIPTSLSGHSTPATGPEVRIRGQRHQPWLGDNRRRNYRRIRSERLPQNSGIADAARTDRSDGRYRAGGGLLRFIRFEMDHRRNTTHRGRSSLGISRKRLQQHERKIKNENEITTIQERDPEQAGREKTG